MPWEEMEFAMASRVDLKKVVRIEDLLMDEDVWGFWDTREDSFQPAGRPYRGVCFLVDSSRIFLVNPEKAGYGFIETTRRESVLEEVKK